MQATTNRAAEKTAADNTLTSLQDGRRVSPKAISRALLLSDESYASVLLLLAVDLYGMVLFPGGDPDYPDGWAPETVRSQLERDFNLVLPKTTFDKLMAAISLVSTNFFYRDVRKFVEICNILSGDDFQPDEFDPADAAEILWGVTEAALIWPPEAEEEGSAEFSDEIISYIKQVVAEEGLMNPPDVLRLGGSPDNVSADFSDDTEMFNAIWDAQQGKNDVLLQVLKENLTALRFQVSILPVDYAGKQNLLESLDTVITQK